jgi:hypothetical protein
MLEFPHDDLQFELRPAGAAWDIVRRSAGGAALLGTGLFPGLPESQAGVRARALVQRIHPVGVRIVAPDVAHGQRIGGLRMVGPDVAHPNFVQWNSASASFPPRVESLARANKPGS